VPTASVAYITDEHPDIQNATADKTSNFLIVKSIITSLANSYYIISKNRVLGKGEM
jgi:hypothetical protein